MKATPWIFVGEAGDGGGAAGRFGRGFARRQHRRVLELENRVRAGKGLQFVRGQRSPGQATPECDEDFHWQFTSSNSVCKCGASTPSRGNGLFPGPFAGTGAGFPTRVRTEAGAPPARAPLVPRPAVAGGPGAARLRHHAGSPRGAPRCKTPKHSCGNAEKTKSWVENAARSRCLSGADNPPGPKDSATRFFVAGRLGAALRPAPCTKSESGRYPPRPRHKTGLNVLRRR